MLTNTSQCISGKLNGFMQNSFLMLLWKWGEEELGGLNCFDEFVHAVSFTVVLHA